MAKNKLDRFIQYLIPPSLILLLIVTIIELFYGASKAMMIFIDIFDIYVITIFAIDLRYRWLETPKFKPYVKKHFLDIIATIPFNLIFLGIEGLALIKAVRGIRIISRAAKALKFARYGKLLRLFRFATRIPRFIRIKKQVKKAKIRKIQPHEKKMKKTLGFKVILLITINSIMGTGIWFLTAAGAKHAGPASLISWGILSIIAIYIAMCFSELTSMFPKAGGVYEFAKQTYGRFWSFVIGWITSIAGSMTIAMLLLGALQYLIPIKYSFSYVPIAIFLVLIFSYVAFRGMKTSKVVLVTFALITMVAIISIIVPGFINFQPEHFSPFFVFPSISILLAIFFIAETFFGWESAIFLSAETKNPSKIMPKALIYGTIIIAILSFFLAFTAMGTIPWAEYAGSVAPLRDLGIAHFGGLGGTIFTFLIFISIIGATAGWIITSPRLLMSIAEDKLFFIQFSKIHPKHKSPYVSILFQAIIVSILILIGAGKYETLLHMLIPLILIVYSAVLLSVVILRFKKPDQPRPYKVIFGKIGPFITILFMIFLLMMFIKETHDAWDILRISTGLVAFGIPSYFIIEMFYDKKYVTLRRNIVAILKHYYHNAPLPKIIFNRILKYVGPINKNTILLDFNSEMGSFARKIIKSTKKFKHIYMINTTKEEVIVIRKKIKKEKNITTLFSRGWKISPEIKKVNVFVSFNTIGYVEDISIFLNHISKILVKKGKFCFYIKHHFFNIAPNSLDLANQKKMKELFLNAGLELNHSKRKLLGKEEIFFYGTKK